MTAPQILTLRRERGRDSMARAEEGKEGRTQGRKRGRGEEKGWDLTIKQGCKDDWQIRHGTFLRQSILLSISGEFFSFARKSG